MTSKIQRSQINAAYDVARRVFAKAIRPGEGVALLAKEHGLNPNSARGYIRCYGHLRNGERYTRTLSNPAAEVFLERIFADDGPEALVSAIAAICAHIEYYENEAKRKSTVRELRQIVERHEARLREFEVPDTLEAIQEQFARNVAKAIADDPAARRERLARAPKKPGTATVTAQVFLRNYDVVAEVLHRANGVCQICGKVAPFKRSKDGTPYLEVHHRVQLADGGEDTVENAVAACPNCHREAHYGVARGTPAPQAPPA